MKDALGVVCVIGNIIVSILVLLAAKFGGEWAQKMMDTMVPMVVQSWLMNFAVIIQYRYGSSAGSQKKTEIIASQKSDIIELTKPVQ
jgi:hypothetical protein